MKFLFCDMGSYTGPDIEEAFRNLGISLRVIAYSFANENEDGFFTYRFEKYLSEDKYDAVFTVNYFPIIAKSCEKIGMIYISWSYDNPLNILDLDNTMEYETNRIFLFDRIQVEKYKDKGIKNVYHLPLAVNCNRLDRIILTSSEYDYYGADISFLGGLYSNSLSLFESEMDDYHKGYIDGILKSQQEVYGYYMIDSLLSEKFISEINTEYKRRKPDTDFVLSKEALSYAIGAQITRLDRLVLLTLLSKYYKVKLYSGRENPNIDNLKYMATAGYLNEMPKVFKSSKINLNINLRISQSGIPLRVFDILGAGGFLLSSYQPEIAEFFEPDKEVVLYDSIEDAHEKAGFYLRNEEIRQKIAYAGYKRVREQFSYEGQLSELLRIAFD